MKEYHELGVVKGTTIQIGKLGASWRLINSKNEPISKSYHRIKLVEGRLIGETGAASEEVIFLNTSDTKMDRVQEFKCKMNDLIQEYLYE